MELLAQAGDVSVEGGEEAAERRVSDWRGHGMLGLKRGALTHSYGGDSCTHTHTQTQSLKVVCFLFTSTRTHSDQIRKNTNNKQGLLSSGCGLVRIHQLNSKTRPIHFKY